MRPCRFHRSLGTALGGLGRGDGGVHHLHRGAALVQQLAGRVAAAIEGCGAV